MSILIIWLIAIIIGAIFWRLFVRGRIINWYGLFKSLPGILLKVLHSIWLSIADGVKGLFVRKKKIEIDLDFYENEISK